MAEQALIWIFVFLTPIAAEIEKGGQVFSLQPYIDLSSLILVHLPCLNLKIRISTQQLIHNMK